MLTTMRPFLLAGLAAGLAAAAGPPPGGDRASEPISTPAAHVQTEAVPSSGDAADDPAIWVHPRVPARSLVLGTDKKGGLHVFDLAGKRVQTIPRRYVSPSTPAVRPRLGWFPFDPGKLPGPKA
jgi:3-phytase